MAAGSHLVKKNKCCVLIWNGEKCNRKSSKMATDSHFVKKKIKIAIESLVIQNGHRQPSCEKKLCIYVKWREMRSKVLMKKTKLVIDLIHVCREMRSKVIFGHPILPPSAIFLYKKINEIKSDFRSKWPPILVFPLSAHEASPGWWQRKGHCQGQVWLIFTYFFKLISSIELLPKCIASCSFSEVILVLFLNFNGVDWF